jgi:hypothetical protein
MSPSIFTIGHSNHPLDRFLALLAQHQVEALVDVLWYCGHCLIPGSCRTS